MFERLLICYHLTYINKYSNFVCLKKHYFKIFKTLIMDGRFFIVFAPALIAASWALYNIGRVLIQQVQKTLAEK
jgi:hypothetical protein